MIFYPSTTFFTITMASKSNASSRGTGAVTAKVTPPATQPTYLSNTQFASLLATIKQSHTRLEQKVANFRSDMKVAQEEAATKVVTRIQRDNPYQYKGKVRKEQAFFNEKAVRKGSRGASRLCLQREGSKGGTRCPGEHQRFASSIANLSVSMSHVCPNTWLCAGATMGQVLGHTCDIETDLLSGSWRLGWETLCLLEWLSKAY